MPGLLCRCISRKRRAIARRDGDPVHVDWAPVHDKGRVELKRHIVVLLLLSLVLTLSAVSAYAVTLGSAHTFGVLAGSTITNTGYSVINGDVGVYPGTAVTGFPPGIVNGTLYTPDDALTLLQAKADLTTAYNAAAGAEVTETLTGQDLGGLTLAPGVYFFSSSAGLTGTLRLQDLTNSGGQWIFQIGSDLTTASGSKVLIDGGTPCDVFWQVGTSATLGTGTVFAGNIMADQSITLEGGTLNGRALAMNAAVTISAAETVNGICGAPPAPAVPEASSVALAMMSMPAMAVWFRRKK